MWLNLPGQITGKTGISSEPAVSCDASCLRKDAASDIHTKRQEIMLNWPGTNSFTGMILVARLHQNILPEVVEKVPSLFPMYPLPPGYLWNLRNSCCQCFPPEQLCFSQIRLNLSRNSCSRQRLKCIQQPGFLASCRWPPEQSILATWHARLSGPNSSIWIDNSRIATNRTLLPSRIRPLTSVESWKPVVNLLFISVATKRKVCAQYLPLPEVRRSFEIAWKPVHWIQQKMAAPVCHLSVTRDAVEGAWFD